MKLTKEQLIHAAAIAASNILRNAEPYLIFEDVEDPEDIIGKTFKAIANQLSMEKFTEGKEIISFVKQEKPK